MFFNIPQGSKSLQTLSAKILFPKAFLGGGGVAFSKRLYVDYQSITKKLTKKCYPPNVIDLRI
jgi:hypothetical protein